MDYSHNKQAVNKYLDKYYGTNLQDITKEDLAILFGEDEQLLKVATRKKASVKINIEALEMLQNEEIINPMLSVFKGN